MRRKPVVGFPFHALQIVVMLGVYLSLPEKEIAQSNASTIISILFIRFLLFFSGFLSRGERTAASRTGEMLRHSDA